MDTHLKPDPDGIYRWTYRLNLLTNPTILITLLKVMALAGSVPVLLVTALSLFEDGLFAAMKAFGIVASGLLILLLVLLIIAYGLMTIIYGGHYQVVFEMDENGILHRQMEKQFKKSQALSILAVFSGLAAGNPQVAGAGLLSSTKRSSYSQFSKVNRVRIIRKRHVIHLVSGLEHNQIYAEDEQFDALVSLITERCKRAQIIE